MRDDGLVADAWDEISPFVDLVDAELAAAGDAPLTFFELLTVLAFVAFALPASAAGIALPDLRDSATAGLRFCIVIDGRYPARD